MKFKKAIGVNQFAERIGAEIFGTGEEWITGINEIHKVEKGDVCFVDHLKYYDKCLNSDASFIIIDQEVESPAGKVLLVCDQPFEAYNSIVLEHRPLRYLHSSVSDSAVIAESAIIEPGVIIGPDVEIGESSVIQSGVVIHEHCRIGNNCLIQSGCIIGTDAFYYKKVDGRYSKWRSGGRVIIEDDVDLGANCTINRGVSGDTIIGRGSKLDCLVHVAHGAVIGEDCLIASQAGIAGKSILGDGVTLYGQVGIAQNANIASGTVILAQSGVKPGDLEKGTYFGSPITPARDRMKEIALLKKLPWMYKQLLSLVNRKGDS